MSCALPPPRLPGGCAFVAPSILPLFVGLLSSDSLTSDFFLQNQRNSLVQCDFLWVLMPHLSVHVHSTGTTGSCSLNAPLGDPLPIQGPPIHILI